MDSNDYELLYMIYQMDESSLQQFMDKYATIIYDSIDYFFNLPKRHYQLDDIIAEAVALLYDAIYSYRLDMDANFSTYYRRILQNMLTNISRSTSTYEGRCKRNMISLDYQVRDAYNPLIDIVANKDVTLEGIYYLYQVRFLELVDELCEVLSTREKRILMLRLKGHSYQEIAELLHIDKKKVDNTLHKIRKKKGFIDYT